MLFVKPIQIPHVQRVADIQSLGECLGWIGGVLGIAYHNLNLQLLFYIVSNDK
jgi:hypothetical protein